MLLSPLYSYTIRMFAKVYSASVVGLDGVLVDVETDILNGLPSFTIVGLPDKAVEEARERVRSAIKNSGADLPAKRITVNLAPADLQKEGPSFDLPIAISLLLASEQLAVDVSDSLFFGELSLDGSLRPVYGALPMVMLAKEKGIKNVYIPKENIYEASIVDGISIYPIENIKQLYHHLLGQKTIERAPYILYDELEDEESYEYDMKDIKGQEFAKRALEIAAAGGHNILLKGPPGAGKTLLARTLPSILPPLTFEEALEVTKLYSISGLLDKKPIVKKRPFRSPHHTTSHIGLIGGSANPKPGEISLSHRGVLFLDEFPEFPRHVLEAMRQPMEDGFVVISRAKERVLFPSRFMLVAALNPCPCGFYGDKTKECSCSISQILRYQKRISGPILDRIDMHVEVPAVEVDKITQTDSVPVESSKAISARVKKARKKQLARFKAKKLVANADMSSKDIKEFVKLEGEVREVLKMALTKLSLSARSYHKLIKVAQTIVDLEGDESLKEIKKHHVLEALQYRFRTENPV